MTTQTDALRGGIYAISAQIPVLLEAVATIENGTAGTPILGRPSPVDCIGGTVPNAIAIPVGDGAPGGAISDPYRTRMLNNLAASL